MLNIVECTFRILLAHVSVFKNHCLKVCFHYLNMFGSGTGSDVVIEQSLMWSSAVLNTGFLEGCTVIDGCVSTTTAQMGQS